MVALATDMQSQLEYAIKFFLIQDTFDTELGLYESKVLGNLLPQVMFCIAAGCLSTDDNECVPGSEARFTPTRMLEAWFPVLSS